MNMILPADILTIVQTKADAQEFLSDIDGVVRGLFTSTDREIVSTEQISYDKKRALFSLLKNILLP